MAYESFSSTYKSEIYNGRRIPCWVGTSLQRSTISLTINAIFDKIINDTRLSNWYGMGFVRVYLSGSSLRIAAQGYDNQKWSALSCPEQFMIDDTKAESIVLALLSCQPG